MASSPSSRMQKSPVTLLGAQQRAIYRYANGTFQQQTLPVEEVADWRSGHLSFRNRELASLIDELSLYRPQAPLQVSNAVAHLKVSGNLDVNDPDALLNALPALLPVKTWRRRKALSKSNRANNRANSYLEYFAFAGVDFLSAPSSSGLHSTRTPFRPFGHTGGFHVSRALPRFAPVASTAPHRHLPGVQPQCPSRAIQAARPGAGDIPEPGGAAGEIELYMATPSMVAWMAGFYLTKRDGDDLQLAGTPPDPRNRYPINPKRLPNSAQDVEGKLFKVNAHFTDEHSMGLSYSSAKSERKAPFSAKSYPSPPTQSAIDRYGDKDALTRFLADRETVDTTWSGDHVRNRGEANDAPYYSNLDSRVCHDYSDRTYTGWSPRLAAFWNVTPDVAFFASWNRTWRAPVIDEQYEVQGAASTRSATSLNL